MIELLLLSIVAARAVEVPGVHLSAREVSPPIRDTPHHGSVDQFYQGRDRTSTADKLHELLGAGDAIKAFTKPIAEQMLGVERFEDTVLRGTVLMVRDYSCGPKSVSTDLTDIRAIHQDPGSAHAYTRAARRRTRMMKDGGLIDENFDSGPLIYALDGPDAVDILVSTVMIAIVLDRQTPFLDWSTMYVAACFFGTYIFICVADKFIAYVNRRPYVNRLGCFVTKRRMHATLANFQMTMIMQNKAMQGRSEFDPDINARKELEFDGEEDEPLVYHATLLTPLARPAMDGAATVAYDSGDETDDYDDDRVMEPGDVPEETVGDSYLYDTAAHSDSSEFRREWEGRSLRDAAKVKKSQYFDSPKTPAMIAHIRSLGLTPSSDVPPGPPDAAADPTVFPTTKAAVTKELEEKHDATAKLEREGIVVNGETKPIQVLWLGSSSRDNTWFPPVFLSDLPRPFKVVFHSSLLFTIAAYLIVRETSLHVIGCLATTCREDWRSQRRGVGDDGRWILEGRGAVELREPYPALIVRYLLRYLGWLMSYWPALFWGLPFRAALYAPSGDYRTATLVPGSGAVRRGSCSVTPMDFPKVIYLHASKETYQAAVNVGMDDQVLDVLDAVVLGRLCLEPGQASPMELLAEMRAT
mmetsp:Transcript_10111/g.32120  ORF Transcript_10111/g.32120 Transcript_10111/m.32120 type:complete len:640 (-) Transcript_10111:31-1950(-)